MMHISSRAELLAPSLIREMFALRRPTSVDLSLGAPSLEPDEGMLDRAIQRLKSGAQGYTDNAGLRELRDAVAKHHRLDGRSAAENVIATVGSEEAVFLSMMCLLDPGDEVLVPDPGYPAYASIARLVGATPVSYPIDRATGLAPRAEAIRSVLSEKTRVLVLNGPSNPFGIVDTASELEAIAKTIAPFGITVISDEVYRDLVYERPPPPSICDFAHSVESTILVSGLSKSCAMTGHRFGYLIGPRDFVRSATLAHQAMVSCAPRLAQLMALEVFERPEILRAHTEYYRASREAVRLASNDMPEDAPVLIGDGAFYAVVDVSCYADGDPLALAIELLNEEDVVVVPGSAFGSRGGWFWRVSYAVGPAASREGITRIARFLRDVSTRGTRHARWSRGGQVVPSRDNL